jgi:hypothetical protein
MTFPFMPSVFSRDHPASYAIRQSTTRMFTGNILNSKVSGKTSDKASILDESVLHVMGLKAIKG